MALHAYRRRQVAQRLPPGDLQRLRRVLQRVYLHDNGMRQLHRRDVQRAASPPSEPTPTRLLLTLGRVSWASARGAGADHPYCGTSHPQLGRQEDVGKSGNGGGRSLSEPPATGHELASGALSRCPWGMNPSQILSIPAFTRKPGTDQHTADHRITTVHMNESMATLQ